MAFLAMSSRRGIAAKIGARGGKRWENWSLGWHRCEGCSSRRSIRKRRLLKQGRLAVGMRWRALKGDIQQRIAVLSVDGRSRRMRWRQETREERAKRELFTCFHAFDMGTFHVRRRSVGLPCQTRRAARAAPQQVRQSPPDPSAEGCLCHGTLSTLRLLG